MCPRGADATVDITSIFSPATWLMRCMISFSKREQKLCVCVYMHIFSFRAVLSQRSLSVPQFSITLDHAHVRTECLIPQRKSIVMSVLISMDYVERLPSLLEALTGLGEPMFELCTRPGKGKSTLLNKKILTTSSISMRVCVGDMDAEQGEKLASELPG
jgi:hypothetical protein